MSAALAPVAGPSSPGFRSPRSAAPCVSVSYPPHIGRRAEPRWRFAHLFGASAIEAVRDVLEEVGRRPSEVRARATFSAPEGEVALIARDPYRTASPGEAGEVGELAVIYGGLAKAEVCDALAALHAQGFVPQVRA